MQISNLADYLPLLTVLREEVDVVAGFWEVIKLDDVGMIKQLPGVYLVLNAVNDVVAFGVFVLRDLYLYAGHYHTFSNIFCLQIILQASKVLGSSTVRCVMAKLPRPNSSFLIMYFPSMTLSVGPVDRCKVVAFYIGRL